MLRYLKITGLFFKLGLLSELEYRANFFVQIFQSLTSLLVSIGGMSVIFTHTDSLNGWFPPELLAVVGVYFIIGALINTIIQPSLTRFMQDIRDGTLDFTLMKPIDAQLVVSVRQMQIWKLVDLGLGLGVLVVALLQLGSQFGVMQALAFLAAMVAGGAIVYSFWLILATLAFWFVRLENVLVIFESFYEAGRWPVGIYPGWLRFLLTFLVPIAFAVTVPAEAITARLDPQTLIGAGGLAVAMLVISRVFWRVGLRNYTGASA